MTNNPTPSMDCPRSLHLRLTDQTNDWNTITVLALVKDVDYLPLRMLLSLQKLLFQPPIPTIELKPTTLSDLFDKLRRLL
jgi:hypothetical protein